MGFTWTVLVGRERQTGTWMATTIPTKGGMGQFGVDKSLDFVDECGDRERDINIKSDQESSAKYLVGEIVELRGEGKTKVEGSEEKAGDIGKTMVEESPVGNSGSNGIVERGGPGSGRFDQGGIFRIPTESG